MQTLDFSIIAIGLTFPKSRFSDVAANAVEKLIKERIDAALGLEPEPSCETKSYFIQDRGLWLFYVLDWKTAFAVIQAQLEELDLLNCARISRADCAEGIWRAIHPTDDTPFHPNEILLYGQKLNYLRINRVLNVLLSTLFPGSRHARNSRRMTP